MEIKPLAFDSFGTRSMCTFVKTKDAKIVIDPGVALAPSRYGLPPHALEIERMHQHWHDIVRHAEKADILIVTHYHYDHHNPDDSIEIYRDKIVFVKNPNENINYSQRIRAKYFLEKISSIASSIQYADGNEFSFGGTKIKFSRAVFHGTNARLGYVVEALIDDGFRLLHTSDVEGPSVEHQMEFVLKSEPNIVLLDGPLSYMLGYRYGQESMRSAVENMLKILEIQSLETLVVDHHFLRDLHWKERIADVFRAAENCGKKVLTAAELARKPIEMLEARRKELYEKHGGNGF